MKHPVDSELFFQQIHIMRTKFNRQLGVVKILDFPPVLNDSVRDKYLHFNDGVFVSAEHKASSKRMMLKAMRTKQLQTSVSYVYIDRDTGHPELAFLGSRWFELQRYAAPTDTDGVLMTTISIPASVVFQNHFDNLNGNKLLLEDGVSLTRKDLKILHYYLSGTSAGDTADKLFVTEKTVHTAISRIKTKIRFADEPDITLVQNLNRRNLIPFIMEKSDWFEYITKRQTKWTA